MKKLFLLLLLLNIGCEREKADADILPDEVLSTVPSFKKDIKPILEKRCSPCHAAAGDRTQKYVEFNTAKTLITGITGRITRAENDPLLMPQNGPKLSQKEIDLILKWKDTGLLE